MGDEKEEEKQKMKENKKEKEEEEEEEERGNERVGVILVRRRRRTRWTRWTKWDVAIATTIIVVAVVVDMACNVMREENESACTRGCGCCPSTNRM